MDGRALALGSVVLVGLAGAVAGRRQGTSHGSAARRYEIQNLRRNHQPEKAHRIARILRSTDLEEWSFCEAEDRLWRLDERALARLEAELRETSPIFGLV